MIKSFLKSIEGDRVLWVVVVILSAFSILVVYSSTCTLAFRYQDGNTEYYILKHIIILVLGFFLMYTVHKVSYRYFSRIAQILYIIAVPLLLYTLFEGTETHEASRWINIPVINTSFQTSDLAKFALILYLSRVLTLKTKSYNDFYSVLFYVFLPVMIITGLIFPANISTSILLFFSSMLFMCVAGIKIKHLLRLGGISAGIFTVIILILLLVGDGGRINTGINRIQNFFSNEKSENFQVEQSKIAIANGMIFGKMPGNSIQRNNLPQAHSDFIFSIIIEEYGFIGGLFIILLYLILLYRGVMISIRAPGKFSALVAFGITFILVFQAFIHFSVVVNLFPVTGQPLPLISMGGTSIWFTSISIGLLLSISKEVRSKNNEGAINE